MEGGLHTGSTGAARQAQLLAAQRQAARQNALEAKANAQPSAPQPPPDQPIDRAALARESAVAGITTGLQTGSLREGLSASAKLIADQAAARVRAKTQAATQRLAKKAATQGTIWVVNLIVSALNIGSGGVALLVDGFVYILTFGWLNLQLFYGTYIAQGKSLFIPPLSTEPFPVGMDRKSADLMLQIAVIALDLLLVIVGICALGFVLLVIWAYIEFIEDPIGFAKTFGVSASFFTDLFL